MRLSLKDRFTLSCFLLLIPFLASAQLQKIYLQPKSPGNSKQSNFVDSIHFIPLEIKDGIELAPYSNVQVTKQYLTLTDFNGKSLVIYTRDGRFVKKVNYKKLGEGFYPGYYEAKDEFVFFGNNRNYALTPKDLIKIRLDWNNPRNKKYFKKYRMDLRDTTFAIEPVELEGNDIIQAFAIASGYNIQNRINTSPLYKHEKEYELKIYKGNKLVKSYFPYDPVDEPRYLFTEENVGFSATDSPMENYITRPYCDTIYTMVRDSVFPHYQLVMPLENSVPLWFFTKPFKSKTDRENFQRNNGWVLRQVNNFYETPSLIYITIRYQQNYEAYIYQKKGNATYKVRSIKADSSQYNLPVLADLNLSRKGADFYTVKKAKDLVTFFEEHKTVPVPKELEEFLKRKPHDAAPVIVEFKLKTTL